MSAGPSLCFVPALAMLPSPAVMCTSSSPRLEGSKTMHAHPRRRYRKSIVIDSPHLGAGIGVPSGG